MQINYVKDDIAFERCVKLIDQVFPGAKQMIAQGKALGANWQDASIPFMIEKNNQVIAHLSIVPLSITSAHRTQSIAALHGICVKKEYRGQGYFKQLMKEAMGAIQKHFDASILFTDVPELYIPFGYEICPQYDFFIKLEQQPSTDTVLRRLYLQQADDLALFNRLYANRIPQPGTFDMTHRTLYLLNSLDMKLFYTKVFDAILVYKAHKKLYLQDILCSRLLSLHDILSVIPEKSSEIILQFHPGQLLDMPYQSLPAKTQGTFMVCQRFSLPATPFRWNEMARC